MEVSGADIHWRDIDRVSRVAADQEEGGARSAVKDVKIKFVFATAGFSVG